MGDKHSFWSTLAKMKFMFAFVGLTPVLDMGLKTAGVSVTPVDVSKIRLGLVSVFLLASASMKAHREKYSKKQHDI